MALHGADAAALAQTRVVAARRAQDSGRELVHRAVAVVVQPVTPRFLRHDLIGTGKLHGSRVVADPARLAGAGRGGAHRETGVAREVGRATCALATFAALPAEVDGWLDQTWVISVSEAIAVVVFAVTDFGSIGRAGVFATVAWVVVGIHPPVLARTRVTLTAAAQSYRVGIGAGVAATPAISRISLQVEVLIDQAVAVVVLAVADLRLRRHHACTDQGTRGAHPCAHVALTRADSGLRVAAVGPHGIAGLAQVGIAFVD